MRDYPDFGFTQLNNLFFMAIGDQRLNPSCKTLSAKIIKRLLVW